MACNRKIGQFDCCSVVQGDCLELMKQLPDGCVDAVITDFPYGVGLTVKTNDFRGSRHFDDGASMRASTVYEDSEEYVLGLIADGMPHILRISERAAIFTGVRMMFAYPRSTSAGCVFVPNGAGRDRWGFGCYQPILYYGQDPYLASGQGSRPNSFTDNQPNLEKLDHPCPKPISWMKWLVNRASLEGETVIDPFLGSGTTAVAAKKLGRHFLGFEISEAYCKIARERLARIDAQPNLFQPKAEQLALA